MARAERKPVTTRSEHWMRCAVEHHTETLDSSVRQAFSFGIDEKIEWLSPTREDGFAEYYDEAFVTRLGIDHLAEPLASFWPTRGPQWDGLGRTSSGKFLLVEAKAYPEEAITSCTASSPRSLALIDQSLRAAQKCFRADPSVDWKISFYQYANRLAHFYFLRERCGIDANLLFLNFADAPDVPHPCNETRWKQESQKIQKTLGLPSGHIQGVATVVFSVPNMLAGCIT